MNTKNLKAYAPKARSQFIEAIKKRAAQFGIYEGENGEARIETVQIEGSVAIIEGRAFTRQEGEQRKRLEKKVAERGYDMFIREMAYTWFNRLAAIRYMELHGYFDHGFRVLSHPSSLDSLPEILSHASDVADGLKLDKSHIIELQLAGDKEEQLYRELLLGQCHQLAKIMPFVFKGLTSDSIDDAAELLLPDNLTKTDSILKGLTTDIPEEDWNDIEVIGWLYQFYISEHKDAVIGKVVKSEDIPAATQLFTPNWIVKYLVQNSLGRQWLATYHDSELKGKMEYYIEPAEQSDDVIEQLKDITPTSIDPEEIKVLDPAAGSGHILVEVYEVLREIYLERGYRLREIPELILTKNIYGLDIDDRAAQLAGFALMMKAREDDRRIFQRVEDGEVSLNVYSLQSTEHLDIPNLWKALNLEGNQKQGSTGGLFDEPTDVIPAKVGIYKEYFELLQILKSAFLQAKTLGSLIQVDDKVFDKLVSFKGLLTEKVSTSDPASKVAAQELIPIINQSLVLAQRYDATVLNPPYMGRKGMYPPLKPLLKNLYPNCIWDIYAAFIEQSVHLLKHNGVSSLITMQSWMNLPAFENLRKDLLNGNLIESLVHLGARAFDSISGEVVRTAAFSIRKVKSNKFKGTFLDLKEGKSEKEKIEIWLEKFPAYSSLEQKDFFLLPGVPLSYWIEKNVLNAFTSEEYVGDKALSESLNLTGDNERFLRFFWEVKQNEIGRGKNWLFYAKGGTLRKWYGNFDYVVAWDEDTVNYLKKNKTARLIKEDCWYKKGITWSLVTSGKPGFRLLPNDALFDVGGASIVFEDNDIPQRMCFLNSAVAEKFIRLFNETKVQLGNVTPLPLLASKYDYKGIYDELVRIHREDWNTVEISHEYLSPYLTRIKNTLLETSLANLVNKNKELIERVNYLENKLNSHFIELYGVSDVLDSEVPLEQITMFSNPYYTYKTGWDSGYSLIQSDQIKEILSYAIGNMMGRYSLDRNGIVYAQSKNEGFKELETEGAYKAFPADDDGIIPLASEEWLFDDDATTRFKEFVKKVWGDDHLSENLEFVAESLCLHALKPVKGENANDTVRRYFSKQFYKDHCKTYKKRPIYWLFSSGKEKAFECLVYLHRYNEGTLSRMRTEYVTPLMGKFDAQHTLLSEQQIQATGTEARRIEKELKTLDKKQAELRTFDEQLKHYAEKRITLDLDDGVKANYGKFGNLLADVKAIHGKAVK